MLEMALLVPVVAALIAGVVGVSMTFVHTMQADQLCKKAVQMAASGADFDSEKVKAEVYALYGGKALQNHNAVLYVAHLVRDTTGSRVTQTYALGRVNRWKSAADSPDQVIPLEPGEDAWVAEVWYDNDSILSTITPKEIHSRSVL